jgi:type III restriction enzyme
MLREGWDVKNVTVIVGLRAYSAKAQILPEQTVGRGLWRVVSPLMHYDEQLDVIGTKAFEDFVLGLEDEGVRFGDVNLDEPPKFETVYVDPDRLPGLDVGIPQLTPILYKSADALGRLTAGAIEGRPFPLRSLAETRIDEYLRYDILSKELVERLKMDIRRGTPGDVLSFFAEQILKKASFPAQFHLLAPVLKEYVTQRLFLDPVDLEDRYVRDRLTDEDVAAALVKRFVDAVNHLGIDSKPAEPEPAFRPVSATPAFQWTGQTYAGKKTVFNLVACDSGLEARLAQFLDLADDVAAYAKNVRQMRFSLDYVSTQGFIRYYYPDFLIRLASGVHYLLETKGAEGIEVPIKDARGNRWAADVTRLTGVEWRYLKLPQDIFDRSGARTFGELVEHTQALAPRQAELVDSLPKVETGVTTTFTLMTPEVVKADLERFEGQFGITSREFLARFAAGAFDEREAISWEFACELADEMGIPYN